MEMQRKVMENYVRRLLKRRGYKLVKSPRRDPGALDYSGYMITDEQGRIVSGSNGNRRFLLSLEGAQDWAFDQKCVTSRLDMMMPNGKMLGDCTSAEALECADFMERQIKAVKEHVSSIN